ncbi:MAG: flotillin family protein, partial [Brachybacterium sp.]
QVLEVLPEVAGELAAPYSNISNLSVFSTDGEAKIGQNISVGLAQVLDMVKSTTGVDFQDTLQRAADGGREVRAQAEQTDSASRPAPSPSDDAADEAADDA